MLRRRPRPLAVVAAALVALALAGAVVAATNRDAPRRRPAPGGKAAALPAPGAALPRAPARIAAALASNKVALDAAIDRWRTQGDPARARPPHDVAMLALYEQRIYRLLGSRPNLVGGTLRRLPGRLRPVARDNIRARRELSRITSIHRGPPPKVRIGPAEPADVLRRDYEAARRRFHVRPAVLAAVNFVESAFGRLRNRSVSGATGPMQFIPATWRAYGLGGDIDDPRDAILGAANYLHANGAPGDERSALFHYNPSRHYVNAISCYARRIAADWRAFYAYYAWQPATR